MYKKSISAIFGLAALTALAVACGKKNDNSGTNPAPPPPPPPPVVAGPHLGGIGSWQTGPAIRASVQANIAFDNSIFTSLSGGPSVDPRMANKAFMVANFDSTVMNAATAVLSDATHVIPVNDPRIYTYLFSGSPKTSVASVRNQSNEAAEMIFDFDGRGQLRFIARVNTVVFEGVNIPYKYDFENHRLIISNFMAMARNPITPSQTNRMNSMVGISAMGLNGTGNKTGAILASVIDTDGTGSLANMAFQITRAVNVNFMVSAYANLQSYYTAPAAQPGTSTTTTTLASGQAAQPPMNVAPLPSLVSNPNFFSTYFQRFVGGDSIVLRPVPKSL